jgi:hypothetical protein
MLSLITYLALKFEQDGTTIQFTAPEDIPTGGLTKGQTVLSNSITLLITSIVILSLFFVIFGGFKWMTSQGDKAKLDAARKTITYAIVGLVLAILSFMIVSFIGGLFGVDLLHPSFN